MKQVDAVFQATCNVLGAKSFESRVELTREQKATVVAIVTEGILNGQVAFSDQAKAKYDNQTKIMSYVNGMVDNHLNKDKRLNGGEKHQIKNPGSRAGSTDPQVKALRQLLTIAPTAEEKAEIQGYLNDRLAEIQASKPTTKKTVTINIDDLPEELRAKYSK